MMLNKRTLQTALQTLGERLRVNSAPPVRLVVCGGSALIAMELVSRTTKDIDVLALVDEGDQLISAVPFPDHLNEAIQEVAIVLTLSKDWLNNGPDFNTGDFLQNNLPKGLLGRAHRNDYGTHLTVFFIDRIDQIHFKVYAAADSLGVHTDDLMALEPAPEEMESAAHWCMKQDPSDGFHQILLSMYEQLGYCDVAERL